MANLRIAEVARALHVEQRGRVIGVRKHKRRRLVDRRRARAGRGVRACAGVQRERVEPMDFRLGGHGVGKAPLSGGGYEREMRGFHSFG